MESKRDEGDGAVNRRNVGWPRIVRIANKAIRYRSAASRHHSCSIASMSWQTRESTCRTTIEPWIRPASGQRVADDVRIDGG
jgi:hypothetical protein